MNEAPIPDWQFWWNWWVQVAVALGTFLAVFVALFKDGLKYWLQPPKLRLALVNPTGERVPVTVTSPEGKGRPTYARYYHLRVSNERRWTQASETLVFLTSIEEPDASGTYTPTWAGDVPLTWQNGVVRGMQPRTIGFQQTADLCNIVQAPEHDKGTWVDLGLLFTPSALPNRRRQPFQLIATFQARSRETDSNVLRIEISWNGAWADADEEMARHMVVKVI